MKHLKYNILLILLLVINSLVWADKTNLSLILAADVSGSMAPIWTTAKSAISSTIDALQAGDKVSPVAFGTNARSLNEPVIIEKERDKIYLKNVFTQLSPADKWTYFTDLFRVTRNIITKDSSAILVCFSDAQSDPGPGRSTDLDITAFANMKEEFKGGGIFVIRLVGTDEASNASVIQRLRKEQEVIKSGGVISAAVNNERLINLMREFIDAIRQSNQLAEQVMKTGSITEPDNQVTNENELTTKTTNDPNMSVSTQTEPSSLVTQKELSEKAHGDTTFISTFVPARKWIGDNWRLLLIIFTSIIVLVGISYIVRNRRRNPTLVANDETTLLNPVEQQCYYLIVNSDNNSSSSYPLVKDIKVTLGTDIPILGINSTLGTIVWNERGIVLEPMVNNLLINRESVTKETILKVGDIIRYNNINIAVSTDPSFETFPDLNLTEIQNEAEPVLEENENLI